jgi:hypothetical protein
MQKPITPRRRRPIAGGEEVGHDRRVAGRGEPIGHTAHVVVEAEHLVDD